MKPLLKYFPYFLSRHETKDEMSQILKSLMRLDEDQCALKNAKHFFKIKIQDYYEFEGRKFFLKIPILDEISSFDFIN